MKAAVCRGAGQPLVVEDVTLADPRHGEVRVKLSACAICHSDISYARGEWGEFPPTVFGHEAAGVVVSTGGGVGRVSVGDHVVVTLIRSCGTCHYCAQGDQVMCESKFGLDGQSPLRDGAGNLLGHGLRTGAFAEEVVVDQSQVVGIPKDIPLDSASLLACGVITGFGAVTNSARVPAGSHVVVIGAGGVGLNCVQGAAISGATSITAVDLADNKLTAAKTFGATHTVNPRNQDATAAVKDITDGRGADYVFAAVGSGPAMESGIPMLRKGGKLVLVGMPPTGVTVRIDPSDIASASQHVIGSKMGSSRITVDIPYLITLYRQERLKLDELITARYPLAQINEAMVAVENGAALRNVIVF